MKKRDAGNNDILRAVELTLQAIAMVLCALILLNMNIENSLKIPTHACVAVMPSEPE